MYFIFNDKKENPNKNAANYETKIRNIYGLCFGKSTNATYAEGPLIISFVVCLIKINHMLNIFDKVDTIHNILCISIKPVG